MHLLIADEQTLTREGVKAIFQGFPNFKVVNAIAGFSNLSKIVAETKPDLIVTSDDILNHFTANHFETLRREHNLRFLLIANVTGNNDLIGFLSSNKINCISKDCSRDEIVQAVQATLEDKNYYCRKISNIIAAIRSVASVPKKLADLSGRELEIVRLIAAGSTNKEIADQLFLSIHTVKTHRKNIIKKLGFTFKNAADLVALIDY